MSNNLHHLKDDVNSFYQWAEKKYPDEENELGLSYMLFELECILENIDKEINHRHNLNNQKNV